MNEILDAVSKETQYFERRIQDFTEFGDEYGTNGFLGKTRFKKSVDWLTFSSIAYIREKDFRSKLRYVDNIRKTFKNIHCLVKPREESVEVVLLEPFDWKGEVQTTGFQLTQERLAISPSELDRDLIEFLVTELLKEHLVSKKLVRVGNTEKFVDFSKSFRLNTRIGAVRCVEGFNMKVEVKKDLCMVWIDPSRIQLYTLMDCINFLRLTYGEKEIAERLKGAKIHVLPRRSEAYITDVAYNQDMRNFGGFDYVNYWKSTYNMDVERNQAIATVSFGQTLSLKYPSDTIYLDK